MLKRYQLIFLGLLVSNNLLADIMLFHPNGNPVDNYHEVVDGLKARQTVVFSDGRRVKLGKKLGEGTNATVFRVSGSDQVIKILSRLWTDRIVYFNEVIDGYQEHAAVKGLNVPRLGEYKKGEYIFVEEVNLKWTLADIFHERKKITKASIPQLKAAVRAFARDTALVARTADFSMENIGFDGEKIVLLDWAKGIEFAKEPLEKSLITRIDHRRIKLDQGWRAVRKVLGEDFFQEVSDIIVRERAQVLGPSASCKKVDLHTSPPKLGVHFK